MNDHSEVEHGAKCVYETLNSAIGTSFFSEIDLCHPGASTKIKERLNNWMPLILGDTFITCLSEHTNTDDSYGRLSMWRAYGGNSGVAIIFKQEAFLSEEVDLGAYTSPVLYENRTGVFGDIHQITNSIQNNHEFLRAFTPDQFVEIAFHALRFYAITTKHPAFIEEKEWRIVCSPSIKTTQYLSQDVESIGAISQVVVKLDIDAAAKNGIPGCAPNDLIDRILIGPTDYPEITYRAMVKLLSSVGAIDASNKVHITNVPLRQNQR